MKRKLGFRCDSASPITSVLMLNKARVSASVILALKCWSGGI